MTVTWKNYWEKSKAAATSDVQGVRPLLRWPRAHQGTTLIRKRQHKLQHEGDGYTEEKFLVEKPLITDSKKKAWGDFLKSAYIKTDVILNKAEVHSFE